MRLWNVDHQPAVIDHDKPAINPGDSHNFSPEQVEGGLGGLWSNEDPRGGLKIERDYKALLGKGETITVLRRRAKEAGVKLPPRANKTQIKEILESAHRPHDDIPDSGASGETAMLEATDRRDSTTSSEIGTNKETTNIEPTLSGEGE